MVKGHPAIGPTKTKSSVREIPVPEKLRRYAVRLRDDAVEHGESFIWYSRRYGRFCNPSSFRKQYAEAMSEIDGVRNLTPHCCRHTFVSQLQAAGVAMETIQALSGHAEIDMTAHYLHVQDSVKTAAIEKLNAAF